MAVPGADPYVFISHGKNELGLSVFNGFCFPVL